jgi:hypothetical protein
MNTETFTHFDPSTHLNTVEDVAAYLEALIEESNDDPEGPPEPAHPARQPGLNHAPPFKSARTAH